MLSLNIKNIRVKYIEKPDFTLKILIEIGVFKAGSKVVSSVNNSIQGVLNLDGSITVKVNEKLQTFSYPSGAARAFSKISINGWLFWLIEENGELHSLAFYKKRYLLSLEN